MEKVIRSGEKNFEEEKAKRLEIPTSDMQEAKKGLTKEEQLRLIFKKILDSHLNDIGTLEDMQSVYIIPECAIKNIVKELLLEVKKRVKL